jgi:hypothetical protein
MGVQPINVSGKITRLSARAETRGGKRWCIICYDLDQPIASTCVEVPCWLLPILKPIRAVG